jgi:hypothetical protein
MARSGSACARWGSPARPRVAPRGGATGLGFTSEPSHAAGRADRLRCLLVGSGRRFAPASASGALRRARWWAASPPRGLGFTSEPSHGMRQGEPLEKLA